MSTFGIQTARAFLNQLKEEFGDLLEDSMSERHALNACLTAYHLHEWVWGECRANRPAHSLGDQPQTFRVT